MVTSYHWHHDDHEGDRFMMMVMLYMTKEVMMTIKCYYGEAPPNYVTSPFYRLPTNITPATNRDIYVSRNYVCSNLIVSKSPPALVAFYNSKSKCW